MTILFGVPALVLIVLLIGRIMSNMSSSSRRRARPAAEEDGAPAAPAPAPPPPRPAPATEPARVTVSSGKSINPILVALGVLLVLWFTIGGGKGFFFGHPHASTWVNPAKVASASSVSKPAVAECADITVDAPIAHTNEQVSGGDFKEKWSDRTPIPQGCRIVGYDPGPEYTFVIKCQDLKGNWHAASTEDGTDVSAGKCDTYQAVELQKLVPDRTHGLDAKTDVEIAERPLRVTLKMGPATP